MTMYKLLAPIFLFFIPGAVLAKNAAIGEGPPREAPIEHLAGLSMVVVLIIGVGLGMLSLLLIYSLLRPQSVRRVEDTLRGHPLRSLITGALAVILTIFAMALADAVPQALKPIIGLPILLWVMVLMYLAVSGLAAVSFTIGDRLLSNVNSRFAGSSFMAILSGGALVVLLGLLPVVGQCLQIVAVICGLGSAISCLFQRRKQKDAAQADAEAPKAE